jgi:nucleotide-binding universal stress UspA family protein
VPSSVYLPLVVLVWLGIGLVAALLFLARRGYRDRRWYFLGAVLGPLFVPMAIERGRSTVRAAGRTDTATGRPAARCGTTVVVGVDGSPESDQAVREAARLFGADGTRFVLIAVADPDIVEFGDEARQRQWHELLAERASWFPPAVPQPRTEIVCGRPDLVLLDVAEAEGADVVVVGRRGKGLSHRLLGSVADHLSHRSSVPVLLTSSTGPRTTDSSPGQDAGLTRLDA